MQIPNLWCQPFEIGNLISSLSAHLTKYDNKTRCGRRILIALPSRIFRACLQGFYTHLFYRITLQNPSVSLKCLKISTMMAPSLKAFLSPLFMLSITYLPSEPNKIHLVWAPNLPQTTEPHSVTKRCERLITINGSRKGFNILIETRFIFSNPRFVTLLPNRCQAILQLSNSLWMRWLEEGELEGPLTLDAEDINLYFSGCWSQGCKSLSRKS